MEIDETPENFRKRMNSKRKKDRKNGFANLTQQVKYGGKNSEETELQRQTEEPNLWATPNAMDHLPQRSEESLKKMAEGHRKGRALPSNLREQVDPETVRKWREAQEPNLWATPTKAIAKGSTAGNPNRPNKGGGRDLRQDVKMYPTPTANDFKGSGRNETMRDRLDYAVEKPDGKRVSGSLNPQWVEWLMGYPVGYTDLDS